LAVLGGLWFAVAPEAAAQSSEAQTSGATSSIPQTPTIKVRSDVVLVPALVKNKAGEVMLSLSSDDFILTDNGFQQELRVEPDMDWQPLALAIVVQTGGQGIPHLGDYANLGPVLDALIGDVPHRVAVIAFDSAPRVGQDFTSDTDAVASTLSTLQAGDADAAILDALNFGVELLSQQPQEYRRAVLLFSETADSGSKTSLDDAVRGVENTNTAIYTFGFSSTRAAVKHQASKLPGNGSYSGDPYPKGGCMSKDPNADPDSHGNRGVQGLDCASDLLPPLRLARMALSAAKEGLKRNVPKSVAQLTGGEYFAFENAATLTQNLINLSNDMPNYYVLSFYPQSPRTGLHALDLKVRDRAGYQIKARRGYWVPSSNQ
jgi:VWFA-related protein